MQLSKKIIPFGLILSFFGGVNNAHAQQIKATSFPIKDIQLLNSPFSNAKKLDISSWTKAAPVVNTPVKQ